MEVYIDDIIIKSKKTDHLIKNLEAILTRLWEFKINLNPEKCIFRLPKGKLLGFIVSE